MSVRSLNKVQLIGNLTRDPNMRFTPNNAAVCSFGLATNYSWTPSDGGERQERVEYHNIVAWGKLAEICDQLLGKGDKVYLDGRLQTRDWKTDEDQERRTTEIVIDNMILLQSRSGKGSDSDFASEGQSPANNSGSTKSSPKKSAGSSASSQADDVADDVPF